MPKSFLVRSMASFSLALPGLERWERPTSAPSRASGVQPGRLAQGPDEKKGRAGRTAGRTDSVIPFIPSRMIAPRWGGVARRRYRGAGPARQRGNVRRERHGHSKRSTKAEKILGIIWLPSPPALHHAAAAGRRNPR